MAVNINVPSQVKTYANLAAFPATGALKTIYIAEDTNKTYRWTGSVYTEISASAAMTWGAIGGTLSNQTDLQSALNAKQDNLGFTPVPTTRTLTINGVTQDLSANRTFTISTGITIGSTAIASGSVGRILFEGAGNVVQESSSLFWDATNNRLGVGTSTPESIMHLNDSIVPRLTISETGRTEKAYFQMIQGSVQYSSNAYFDNVNWQRNNTTLPSWNLFITPDANDRFTIRRTALGSGPITWTDLFSIRSTGNVLINTTTDAGFRLDVNGTARVVGPTFAVGDWSSRSTSIYVRAATGGSENRGFFIGYGASNDGNAGSITYQPTGNLLNIRSPYNNGTIALSFEGNTNSTQFHNTSGVVHSKIFANTGNWAINTTTDAGFRLDVNGTARVQGQLSLGVTGTAGRVNLARSSNGTMIGAIYTSGNDLVIENGSQAMIFNTIGAERMRFAATTANLLIGTTTDVPSALVTISSTTQGFLPPRMTTTQKNAIASPAAGLMVYDTTLNVISYYNGSMWI